MPPVRYSGGMENTPDTQYLGQGKLAAGFSSFVASAAAWHAIPAALTAAIFKKDASFLTAFKEAVSLKSGWGKASAAVSLIMGGMAAMNAFGRAEKAEQQHNQLVAENNEMRGQLDQTGKALQQVATAVEGSLANVDQIKKGGHVERLAERDAAREAEGHTIH